MCYPYLIPRKIIEKLENFRFFEAISPVRIRLENSGCLMPSPDQDYHKQSGSDFGIWDMAFSSTFRGPAGVRGRLSAFRKQGSLFAVKQPMFSF